MKKTIFGFVLALIASSFICSCTGTTEGTTSKSDTTVVTDSDSVVDSVVVDSVAVDSVK